MLYHVSENPTIKVFEPQSVPSPGTGVEGNAVWTVDEKHLVNYLLPRDCPRVTFGLNGKEKEEDRKAYWPNTNPSRVIAVEEKWLPRIEETTLYLYKFNQDEFHLANEEAGYFISRTTVTPIGMRSIDQLIPALKERQVEFRTLKNLWPLFDQISQSSLEFSMIRMRNALPREC